MPIGDTKKCNAGCDESTVHECVIDVDNCGCECESETRQEIGCARYVSVLFYCVRPSSSFASPSAIRRLGLGPPSNYLLYAGATNKMNRPFKIITLLICRYVNE